MQHISSSFQSEDCLRIHTEAWLPVADPKAVVVVVHGVSEHVGRYAHVAAALVDHGYAVYGYDHRGHGQSGGKRGYFETFEHLIDDLAHYLKIICTTQAGKPLFLLGHSMGALATLGYTLRTERYPITGAITTSIPLAIDDNLPNFVVAAARTINQVAPEAPLVSLDITGMSRDPAVLATWTADPHVNLTLIPVRAMLGVVGTVRHIRAHFADISVPMLIMHGEGDRIVDMSGSVALFEGISSVDKTLKLYPELYHELVNEPERDMVLRHIITWLDERVMI